MDRKIKCTQKQLATFYGISILFLSSLFIFTNWLPRYPDAFGYLSSAKFISDSSNFTWCSITESMNSYYAYGYGIFISILFKIFDSYQMISRGIFIFNITLLIGIYVFLIKITDRLLDNLPAKIRYSLCFIICLYPPYLYQIYVVSPEILAIFLTAATVYLFIKLEESTNIMYSVLLGAVVSFMPAVHGRCLGIWAICVVVICFMMLFRKIKINQFICFLIITIIGILIYRYVNDIIKADVFILKGNDTPNNSFTFVSKSILSIFSVSGIINILTSLFTQLFYLGSTTFLISFVGLSSFIVLIFEKIKYLIKNREIKFNKYDFTKIYICLSAFAIMFLSSVLFRIPRRMDHVLYGRHNEMFLPFIIVLGYSYLSKKRAKRKIIFFCSGILLICSLIVYIRLTNGNFSISIPRTIIGLSLFYDTIINNYSSVFMIALISILSVVLYLYLSHKYKRTFITYTFFILVCVAQLCTSYKAITTEREEDFNTRSVFWSVQSLLDYNEIEIYAVNKKKSSSKAYLLQLMAMDKEVNYLTGNQIVDAIQESDSCGLIYSDKKIDLNLSNKECYYVSNILENSDAEIWIYGHKYAEYLIKKGFILIPV